MRARDDITPLIITFNEADNIGRTLTKLAWARRIVVVDSGSTDTTLEILRCHPQVHVVQRPFDDAAAQCNFGLTQVKSDWVLSLDADYVLSDQLPTELSRLDLDGEQAGYAARFVYCIFGRPLRGSLYPPRIVLYRRERALYINEGHTQRARIDGPVGKLNSVIFHDDRKPLGRWLSSQKRYAALQAGYLVTAPQASLRRNDRIRLAGWPAPLLVFVYTLLLKGCIFDGWAGWYYVLQRVLAETLIALELADRRLRPVKSVEGELR